MSATRKRTVFEPCERHTPMMAAATRYRRAEIMVEGGFTSPPDFYTADFVATYPTYQIGDDQR